MQYSLKTLLSMVTAAALASWQFASFGFAGAASGSITLVACAFLLTRKTRIELRLILLGALASGLAGAVDCAYGSSWTVADYLASLVASGDVVYAVTGMAGNAAAAVRAGGHADVTKTHVVWKANLGAYVPSPVVNDGYLYWVSDRGIACCVKADTGEVVYKERVPGAKDFYSSVLLADGRLYAVSRTQGMFVLAANPKFELLAHNELASDTTLFNASPAVSHGQLLLRSNRSLYCIGAAE